MAGAEPRRASAVDLHACGEPGRVIVGGVRDVPGRSMFEKMQYLARHEDGLRLYGPADVDERVEPCHSAEVGNGIPDRRLRLPVEDEPHGAVVTVLTEEDDRAPEGRVEQRGSREEELAFQ